jgi:hypothetical protein
MNQLYLAMLLVGLVQSSACSEMLEKCDAPALPIAGAYELRVPNYDFTSLRLDVGEKDVEMSYTRPDGSKWKASYRITARGKGHH